MYPALLIPDVQAYIFASIKEDKQASRATFAILARTCRLFGDASLDALWSDLHSLRPLASCIYMANTLSLSNEITTKAYHNTKPDLSIFYKYAYRVRKLDAAEQLSPARDLRGGARYLDFVDDLGALLYYTVPSPLLPNLRHLTWPPGISVNLLRHLLTPHLLSLKIPLNAWVSESSAFALTKIPELCPNVKSFTLQIQSVDQTTLTPAQNCVSQVISSLGQLEELDCNVLTTTGVLRLFAMSPLRILRLQITSSAVVDLPPESLSFPSLHTLQFEADTMDTIIAFIKAMTNLPKSLKIDAHHIRRGSSNWEIVGLLLHLIADASRCELRNFSMILPYFSGDDPADVVDILRPLFTCRELRTLHIQMLSQFTLGDDNLRMMAAAWPWLEELELIDHRPARVVPPPCGGVRRSLLPTSTLGPVQPTQPPQPPSPAPEVMHIAPYLQPPTLMTTMGRHPIQLPQHLSPPPPPPSSPAADRPPSSRTAEISFHGLISLLDLCPKMHYFDLAIDATRLEGLGGHNPGGGVCNRLVKKARLVDSPIRDSEAVARILLNILPELDEFVGLKAHLLPHHNMRPQRWTRVRQIMRDSRRARTQLVSET